MHLFIRQKSHSFSCSSFFRSSNLCWLNPCFLFLLLSFFLLSAQAQSTTSQSKQQNLPTLRIALPDVNEFKTPTHEKFILLNGFLKEYWQIWSIDNSRKVAFSYLNNEQAMKALTAGKVDVVAISLLANANSQVLLSIPYAKYQQQVYRKLESETQNGLQIGMHAPQHKETFFVNETIKPSYFHRIEDMLENLNSFDAMTSTAPWRLTQKLTDKNLLKNYYTNSEEKPEVYLHFATRASDRALLATLNESLRSVSELQAQLWSTKYLAKLPALKLAVGKYLTNLSEAEKQYVIDHQSLYYPVNTSGFAPLIISQQFNNITERGLSIDVAKLITEKTGLIFKPLYTNDENQYYHYLTNGQADVAILARATKEHQQNLAYSLPYLTSRYNLIHRIDQESTASFNQLTNESIAVVKDKHTTNIIKAYLPKADIHYYANSQKAILAVAKGQVDIFIGSPLHSGFIIKKQHLPNITSKPMTSFPAKEVLSFATANNNTVLMTLLNRSLNTINAQQLEDIYSRWRKTAFNQSYNKEHVATAYRNMSYVLAATIVTCLIIFWIYYRQLQVRKAAQHKVEQALTIAEAARLEAERSAQAKVAFLARMSHEIRTPMNGVLGMAESLAFTQLNHNQQELLDTLKISARNLLALLNDVLDFSKMEAGKLTLESVPVNILSLTENIIAGFKHLHFESAENTLKDIDINLKVDKNITHQYFSDPTRLTQVLNNLLSNAVKFTQHGAITVSINLESSEEKSPDNIIDNLHFSVQDSGIGIAKDKQRRLFNPFVQADSHITREYGGTGLGLSICQEIVKSMGSKIRLESKENQGSLFHFYLKLKQANPVITREDRRRSHRITNAPDDDRFHNFRVLVAEDNSVNLLVITAQLARLNINADVAEDGEQALKMYREKPYDIIISDCHMPKLDGFELATMLNQEKKQPLWLIAMTADALSGAAEKCYQAGFDDYIAKPCPQEEVTNKLNNAYRQLTKKTPTVNGKNS